jgi:hypothetical protein
MEIEITEIDSQSAPLVIYAVRADVPSPSSASGATATLPDGGSVSVSVVGTGQALIDPAALAVHAPTVEAYQQVLVDIQTRIADGQATPVLASHLDALGLRDAVEAWARGA